MNYDRYGAWGCIDDLCDMLFESEADLVEHERRDHLPQRTLRLKREPVEPTQAEIDEAIASIATAAKPNI